MVKSGFEESNVVLALDASFRHTGYAVISPETDEVVDHGVLDVERITRKRGVRASDATIEEIRALWKRLRKLVEEHSPVAMVIETPTCGGKSARAVAAMSIAQAACAILTEESGLPVDWVVPSDSKKSFAGSRTATKVDMEKVAAIRWPDVAEAYKSARSKSGYNGKFEHVADALAAYVTAAEFSPVLAFYRRSR